MAGARRHGTKPATCPSATARRRNAQLDLRPIACRDGVQIVKKAEHALCGEVVPISLAERVVLRTSEQGGRGGAPLLTAFSLLDYVRNPASSVQMKRGCEP